MGAEWIQENCPERLPLKRALYKQLEALIDPSIIIASSSSAFRWSELSEGMSHPNRLITAHPFNPPHLLPLVEIYGSDARVVERAVTFFADIARKPVVLKKDAVGHIANRLSSALWREAVSIVAEGVASVEDVDTALVNGPGLRWAVNGSHLTYHLGGGAGGIREYLDQLGPSQERRWASLGSPSLTPDVKQALISGIDAEVRGRSIAELAAERDSALIRILKVRGLEAQAKGSLHP
jgi:carnitine 3-dehydrogenase